MMRQSPTAILILIVLLLFAAPAGAFAKEGERGFALNLGFSDPKSDNSYRSDQALNFSYEYEKTGYASYRGTAGFMSLQGREQVSPEIGTRSTDALYLTGNIVFTPRFAIVHPLFIAGVGVYSFRTTDNVDSRHDVALGVNFGAGLDIQLLRHFALRSEYLLHYTTGKIANPIQTLTIGGHFMF
ncbi:MAG TPA: outer membrane beta-barrel protein [Candidatus Polarisedimenticolia bacterium]